MNTGYTPVQFGNNSTMGTNDVFKQISSNKTSSTGNKSLADLYKKYFGDSKTTSNNNSQKIDANTGNSFYNGLANLGQFLGIGKNVPDNPTLNVWLTGDHDTDQKAIYDAAKEAGLTSEQLNFAQNSGYSNWLYNDAYKVPLNSDNTYPSIYGD